MQTTGTSSSGARELLAAVERVAALDELSAETIGQALGATLTPCDRNNPYFHFFEAALDSVGARADFKTPGEGATSTSRILTIAVDDDGGITESEIEERFGKGNLGQIMPRARPEGLVTMTYTTGGPSAVMATFTETSRQLRSITVRQD